MAGVLPPTSSAVTAQPTQADQKHIRAPRENSPYERLLEANSEGESAPGKRDRWSRFVLPRAPFRSLLFPAAPLVKSMAAELFALRDMHFGLAGVDDS
jgi:hypothetical protein